MRKIQECKQAKQMESRLGKIPEENPGFQSD